MSTTKTQWIDTLSGEQLDRDALAAARVRAHVTYEANVHIFEDEADALTALGIVPMSVLAA